MHRLMQRLGPPPFRKKRKKKIFLSHLQTIIYINICFLLPRIVVFYLFFTYLSQNLALKRMSQLFNCLFKKADNIFMLLLCTESQQGNKLEVN
jgi:hypothetical protein